MICLKCGHKNSSGANNCEQCGAMLPKMTPAAVETAPPPKVNERYMLLKDAGDKVKSGEWAIEEYGNFLHEIQSVLAQKELEIREIEIPEEAIDRLYDRYQNVYGQK